MSTITDQILNEKFGISDFQTFLQGLTVHDEEFFRHNYNSHKSTVIQQVTDFNKELCEDEKAYKIAKGMANPEKPDSEKTSHDDQSEIILETYERKYEKFVEIAEKFINANHDN